MTVRQDQRTREPGRDLSDAEAEFDPNRIVAISFDGDGTLWDFEAVMRHSLHHALVELHRLAPHVSSSLSIETMIAIRNQVADELRGRVTSFEAIRLEAFRRTLEHVGDPNDALAAHLNEVYLKHRFEDIELFPDVLPTLDALRDRFTLGLLSNGNSYPERCGLGGRFRFVVFSQDHGFEKPDPRLLEVAVRRAGCAMHQLLHVGDSLRNDVAGARGAGVWSVWLNREGRPNDTGIAPDLEISSLLDLADICGVGEC